MIKLCKLTTQTLTTHNGFQWELGKPAPELSGEGGLCGPGYYHCYTHPLLAVLLNPIHADFKNPRLFLIEAGGVSAGDHGLKMGFTRMKLTEEISLPEFTTNQHIAFGIYCALEVCKDEGFKTWAENWLSGKDRSQAAAAERAAWAAERAAWAAERAARAARAAEAAWAAEAAEAAWAAERATTVTAAKVAEAAATAAKGGGIDLIALAERAYNFEKA